MNKYILLIFAIVGASHCVTVSPTPKNPPTNSNRTITAPANNATTAATPIQPAKVLGSTSSAKVASIQPANRLGSSPNKSVQSTTKKSGPANKTSLETRFRPSKNITAEITSRFGSSNIPVVIEISNRLGYVFYNKTEKNRVITNRLGESLCTCVTYHLCDKKNLYLTDKNDDLSTVSCENQYQACCITPAEPLIMDPSSSLVSDTSTGNGNCVCVTRDQCNDQTEIDYATIIVPKIPCSSDQICCTNLTSVTTGSSVGVPVTSTDSYVPPVDSVNPSVTPVPDPSIDYVCVPSYKWCNNASLTENYGFNVIMERVSPCSPTEYNCPSSDIIVPTDVESSTGTTDTTVGITDTPVNQENLDYTKCGYRKLFEDIIANKITGDASSTSFGEFPWMVLIVRHLGDRDSVVCGGSIVTPKLVLTAAHCVATQDKNLLTVRAGEYDTLVASESETRPHQDRSISEVIIHPAFRPGILHNDFALLIVNTEFKFATNVGPVCLPIAGSTFFGDDIYDPANCIATGWGKNAYDATATFQNTLKKVDLKYIGRDECEQRLRTSKLGSNFKLDTSFICAEGNNGADTCQGDGGGPLFCALKNTPNRYIQVGVTSWGIGCGNQFPGVYASVHSAVEWLTTEFLTYNNFELYTRIKV